VVFGAGSGIGLATVELLGGKGDRVIAVSRSPEPAAGSEPLSCDIRDFGAVRKGIASIRARGPIDYVVNAAGVGFFAPLDGDHRLQWAEIIDTNLKGLAHVLAAVRIEAADVRDLVQIGSMAAHRPSRTPGNSVYAATKVAGRALVDDFRRSLRATGNLMRVTLVSPGLVRGTGFGEHFFDAGPEHKVDLYADAPSLLPGDVARGIAGILELPPEVEVGDLILRNRAQVD
jgi:NADP-dependent 3-hydroxy acid dehydrogenase YdfG